MEPEGSLPHLQVPATCPYPKPDQLSPRPPIPLPEESCYYYPPIYVWVLKVVSFPSGFPTKTLYTSLLSPYVLHAPSISFFSIWLSEYLMMSTDHHPNGRKSKKRRTSKVCFCADPTQNLNLKKMGTKYLRKHCWLHAKISGRFQMYTLTNV